MFINQKKATSMMEILLVVAIMGIVLFVTLPRLSQSKQSADEGAMKAKIAQINAAKDAYISVNGIDNAETAWAANTTVQQRYVLLKPYIPNAPALATEFVINGYLLYFQYFVTAPAEAYIDANLNGAIDSGEIILTTR